MGARFNDRDTWALWLDQYATGQGYLPLTSTDLGSTRNFQRADAYDLGGTRKRHGSLGRRAGPPPTAHPRPPPDPHAEGRRPCLPVERSWRAR